MNQLNELQERFALLEDLKQAMHLLSWDQSTYMPKGASQARGQQLASLGLVHHEKLTDPKIGNLIDDLEQQGFPSDSDEAAFLVQARRLYDQATKLPASFVEEMAKHKAEAHHSWVEARKDNKFAMYAPLLKKMFELQRQKAEYLGYETHPYDVLHDHYEPGSTSEQIKEVFTPLRQETISLLEKIADKPLDDSVVHQAYQEELQEQFAKEVIRAFGYDFDRGRLDRTVHPFAQSISKYDVRITTRYHDSFLNQALFGTLHEAGHAIYEQGIADAYYRSPLGEAVSLGVHESQSRLWENLIGRSYGFWQWAYPRLKDMFPEQLTKASLENFYKAVNKVMPSLIRVEADEVTYNLHVMIRFELELALLEGSLNVDDLPQAWNEKYKSYMGVEPKTDAEGCLQDIHWSIGLVGYFPTYSLGNIMSVQLFEAAKKAHPNIEADLKQGEFSSLLSWLQENIHQHGAKYQPMALLQRATGTTLDAGPYVAYLNKKFTALYDLG